MSLTLAQAIPPVGPYVENGQCDNASIVPVKINEAAAREHAMGDFVGSIKRWGCTVSVDGTFTTPPESDDIRRVSSLAEGIEHSPTGIVFMDDAQAFIYDNTTILPIRQLGSGLWKILGANVPEAVDIMGKVKVVYATADTDLLPISDPYALKMGVLALYYEESNQLELAQSMWATALKYLSDKTTNAILGARRVKFSSILDSAAQNTAGYCRAKFALATTDGLAVDDHKSLSLVNDSLEALMAALTPWEEILLRCNSGILPLPPQYQSIYRLTINNCPSVLRSNWFEFVQGGVGYREEVQHMEQGQSSILRGPSAVHTFLPEAGKIRVSSVNNDKAVKVNIEGLGEGDVYLRETVTVSEGQQPMTVNTFFSITSITKDPSAGDIIISVAGVEVAYMYSWQQDSQVMLYHIPSSSQCTEQIIRAIVRPRFFPLTSDYQRVPIPYPYAISLMAQAILAQRAGSMEISAALKTEAVGHIESAMRNSSLGESNVMDIQRNGFGYGGLRSRL